MDNVEIDGDFIQILQLDVSHRYLGRHLNLSNQRCDMELKHRKQQVWFAFKKHQKVLLNKNVSLKKRLQYFDMCISPCILYALVAFPMSKSHLEQVYILQRKMIRIIVGWRRNANEDWRNIMRRMKMRLEKARDLFAWKNWSTQYARNQWNYLIHILLSQNHLWVKDLCTLNFDVIADPISIYQPHRSAGRPRIIFNIFANIVLKNRLASIGLQF